MTTHASDAAPGSPRREFEAALEAWRPQLLRYCARITGSAADGEDVVQEALLRALAALDSGPPVLDRRAWLFRIAHNLAIDHLRRARRFDAEPPEDVAAAPEAPALEAEEMAGMALALFLRLTPLQRSSVFLMDVMGYSLKEIAEFHGAGVPAVKAALHRGRARLRELAAQAAPPPADADELARLDRYLACFSARDFDALRALLSDDVRLDLVGRLHQAGRDTVGNYFTRYAENRQWRAERGWVDGRPALLVFDPAREAGTPDYFILVDWQAGRIARIRDFRYARHVMAEAQPRRA